MLSDYSIGRDTSRRPLKTFDASGVKRGNLFYYFDNKEEIAHAAIAHAVDRHKAYFDGIKTQDTDPLHKVELMIDGMVEYAVQRGCKAC